MGFREATFDFLDRCDRHGTLDSLYVDFAGFIALLGFDNFVVTGTPEPGESVNAVIVKCTYPRDWLLRYAGKKYHLTDPVALMSVRSVGPFTWREAVMAAGNRADCARFLEEAASFGLRDGFAMPLLDSRTFQAVVSLASDQKIDLCRADQCALSLASTSFKLAVDGLTKRPGASVVITPREREVLSWVAVGKTQWEVASILNIAKGTVGNHLAAIHRKLDVRNTAHAVTKAIRQRLI